MELNDTSFGDTKVPWNSMECSMEFHGTKWYVIWRHQSSMEFHGIFHGIPWNTCVISNGALLFQWNPTELGDFFIWPLYRVPRNSMVYPWKSRVAWYVIKWQSQRDMEFHGTKWYFIWRHQTSMEYRMDFHGTCVMWNGTLLIPWNPMDLGDFFNDFLFGDSRVPWHSVEYSLEVQGNRS